jgi:hypothetical protein
MKCVSAIFAFILLLLGNQFAFAQGYLVPNGVRYNGYTTGLGSEVHVIQNPANGDYTGFNLKRQGADAFSFSVFVDEGVRAFVVSANDAISLQAIQSQGYTELAYSSPQVFYQDDPFYLGFYTGYNPFALTNIDGHVTGYYTGIYTDPVFGWGKFVNYNGVIELLDSALEYGGGGIYAGTQNIIPAPEPSGMGLIALGVAALRFNSWRRNSLR